MLSDREWRAKGTSSTATLTVIMPLLLLYFSQPSVKWFICHLGCDLSLFYAKIVSAAAVRGQITRFMAAVTLFFCRLAFVRHRVMAPLLAPIACRISPAAELHLTFYPDYPRAITVAE